MANILVVEDEETVVDVVRNVLSLDGHELTIFASPIAALHFLESGELPVDLLLTNITTRPISGFELARRLSNRGFNRPVLFMSGYPAKLEALAELLGGRPVLRKPFTAVEVRSAVGRLLARSTVSRVAS